MQPELSKQIQQFAANFLGETALPYRATDNAKLLTHTIPIMIREQTQLGEEYKIYGSVGNGNWSEIPWFAVLDKSITTSTTTGYYIVALFDKDMQHLNLGLAVGWSQFENEYGIKDARQKIQAVGKYYARALNSKPDGFEEGLVSLGAENTLGKGYEIGSVFSKKYSVVDLSDEVFFSDLQKLLVSYQELKGIVGSSILNLDIDTAIFDQSVSTFRKKVATASFSTNTEESLKDLIEEANGSLPEFRTVLKREIVRNRKFADFVKERAKHVCEVCGKQPFIQKNGKPYAEADHINPLGGATRGTDSPDNMRCLCAQCHAVITHGSPEEIAKLLTSVSE